MQTNDLMLRAPLGQLELSGARRLPEGGFGAVLARAGVGKTAFLVQLAIDSMLHERNVLHISLDDPVSKVTLWYREVFQNLAPSDGGEPMDRFWETIQPRRFIMTFKVEGFSVPKLEERLTDLTSQEIFRPETILIDGLPFEDTDRENLERLQRLAREHATRVWFTVRTHRHEAPDGTGMPPQMKGVADLFDALVLLQPEGKRIHVRLLKGGEGSDSAPLLLDPATMLVCDGA